MQHNEQRQVGLPGRTPRYGLALVAGGTLCVAASVVGEVRFGSSLYFFTDVKDKPGAFQGSMTICSGFLLVAAAALLWRTAEGLRSARQRGASAFAAFAVLLAFLAFDELAMFHEWLTEKLVAHEVPAPFGADQDVYIFAGYGLVAAACAPWLALACRGQRVALRLATLMVLFALASEAIDFVPWDSLTDEARRWLGPLEESLKTMATLSATLTAHALLDGVDRHTRSWRTAPAVPY